MRKNLIVGVDVGGTFTDVFILDEISRSVEVAKVPTTPLDQSIGFLDGILTKVNGLSDVATVIHGTTVATNALLERNSKENAFFAEVWQSQKDFAEIAVPFWSGAQTSNAKLGMAFANTLK